MKEISGWKPVKPLVRYEALLRIAHRTLFAQRLVA